MLAITLDPLGWPVIKVLGPQFLVTVHISEVNGAEKIEIWRAGSYEQELRPV